MTSPRSFMDAQMARLHWSFRQATTGLAWVTDEW